MQGEISIRCSTEGSWAQLFCVDVSYGDKGTTGVDVPEARWFEAREGKGEKQHRKDEVKAWVSYSRIVN